MDLTYLVCELYYQYLCAYHLWERTENKNPLYVGQCSALASILVIINAWPKEPNWDEIRLLIVKLPLPSCVTEEQFVEHLKLREIPKLENSDDVAILEKVAGPRIWKALGYGTSERAKGDKQQ